MIDEEESRLVMAIIRGAAEATKYKDENPRASEQEVIQHVTDSAKKMLEKIDDPL
jgi:hypothetical protein